MIINNNIGPALQAIFYKLFNGGKLLLCKLHHIFPQRHPIFFEVCIEIGGLVILPPEFLILHPILAKLNRINLSDYMTNKGTRDQNKSCYPACLQQSFPGKSHILSLNFKIK